MKTNDKDIEKMAEKFAEMLDEDGTPLVDAGLFQGYKAGFKACEAKMLAEASEGFEEWYYDNVADGYRENYLEAFTSGAMSQAKRDAEELRLMSEVNRGLANRNHDLSLRARELKDAIKFLIPLAVCDAFKEVARLDEIREALKQGGER
ncbi:MAG: hypothetical protein ACK5X3_22510 [Pseudomonadota bacterium]